MSISKTVWVTPSLWPSTNTSEHVQLALLKFIPGDVCLCIPYTLHAQINYACTVIEKKVNTP